MMQRLLRLLYPPQCLACPALTETEFGLCSTCWRGAAFISGAVCDTCGTPLPGDEGPRDNAAAPLICDNCMRIARPWAQGRAALLYNETGRRIVLSLKHGDRTDLARPCARWMAKAAAPMLSDDTILVPVPLHWLRFLRRRYNQAALLADELGRLLALPVCPDLLLRPKATPPLQGKGRDARFAELDGALKLHPARQRRVAGKSVLLIDDVMTSGATLAAATELCHAAGARRVCVLTLARVAKDA